MIYRENGLFALETKETTYCFRILNSGHLEHLYYGQKINLRDGYEPLTEKIQFLPGNEIAYSKEYPSVGLENICQEISSYGKGDIREPYIELVFEDGSSTCDFLYQGAKLIDKKEGLKYLPSAYDENGKVQSLEIETYDKAHDISLFLIYSVFYESNVITRSARIENGSNKKVVIERIMSGQLDLDPGEYVISSFHGAWAREMEKIDIPCRPGRYVSDSKAGISSSRSNPFFMVSDKRTVEEYGDCYGFNLIYSGNHYEAIEVSSMGKVRIINGIQPSGFSYLLEPGEMFESPESVMTFSGNGYQGMSRNMHHFIRNHIVRGVWKKKERPVLINSWESNYFKFTESSLIKLAKTAKEVGIELFVLDDGWFGKRNDDTSSLGDWYANLKKLPGGLKGIADKINELGMDFGIWVEPEMINEDSDCYRLHPDWAVTIPGSNHSTGRNQMILDLTKEQVRAYIIDTMSQIFLSGNISYVKWDMNRIFSDNYSSSLPAGRQKEFNYRYIIGLYEVLHKLTNTFPDILFESCSAGGNRFDLGMLCYMPQVWASDNTDAICRAKIQTGYSYGYPMSVIGAHVSGCPNHQTLRNTSIDTRFEVAAFGLLGYECNLNELSGEELERVKEQVAFYKKYRKVLQFGDFYRVKNGEDGIYQWITVGKDKSKGIALYLQKEVIPNYGYGKLGIKGLDPKKKYHFTNRQRIINIKEFGDLINMISPVHIKKDSLVHNVIAKIKKMPGEIEDYIATGDVFNLAGVKLKQGFSGTGYNDEVRLFGDFASRMYILEEVAGNLSNAECDSDK